MVYFAALSFFKRIFSADYRAARSAEAAGHLEQAAEHYALAGEHSEAARVHLARSERAASRNDRIAALRDALHWAGETPELERKILERLGRTMWEQLQAEGIATQRDNQRVREAAEVLIQGGDYKTAGEAYEAIDALQDAAQAYKRGGLVERMEMALTQDEERVQRERALRDGFANYQMHMRIGDRDAARNDLQRALSSADKKGEYRRLLDELESRLITGGVVAMRKRQGPQVSAAARSAIVLGRDNLCEMPLRAGGISRHHAEISLIEPPDPHRFQVRDVGSRNGTFLAGMAIDGVVPLAESGRITLGEHCDVDFRVSGSPAHLYLDIASGMDRGRILVAAAEDEAIDIGQFFDARIALVFRRGRPFLQRLAEGISIHLGSETIAHGEVQLIHGDQLVIDGAEIEVL